MADVKTTLKRHNGTDWDRVLVASSSDMVKLGTEIVTTNEIGALPTGTHLGSETSMYDVVNKMLQKRVPPTYIAPTAEIVVKNKGAVVPSYSENNNEKLIIGHRGENCTLAITIKYNKNSGGDMVSRYIKINDIDITPKLTFDVDSTAIVNISEHIDCANTSNLDIVCGVTYADGPVLNDNMNEPSTVGQIKAGKIETSYKLILSNVIYFKTATTRNEIITNKDANLNVTGYSFYEYECANNNTINIPKGTVFVAFAQPADMTKLDFVQKDTGTFLSNLFYNYCNRPITITKDVNLSYNITGINFDVPLELPLSIIISRYVNYHN